MSIFVGLVVIGVLGAVAAVGAFVALSQGLPDPNQMDNIPLSQQSVIYDRTGKIQLATFGTVRRDVVAFNQISPTLVDATTAVEDHTFWTNAGFDPLGIFSAALDSITGRARGASTITQQLVRQRLLPQDLVQDPHRTFERKAKEIIQSIRLTQAFPGEQGKQTIITAYLQGKQTIITAYLNQNYYGNQDYGVAAAARDYFGVTDLMKLTLAQAAIIAALPQSPSQYDLVRNAVDQCSVAPAADGSCPAGKSRLVVPSDSAIVQRRNFVLDQMASGRTPLTGTQYTAADYAAAKQEPVVLAPQTEPQWIAPHFVWAVRDELTKKLCGTETTCPTLERGGLTVVTTLDARLQTIAERWVKAAAVVPNAKNPSAAAKGIGLAYQPWMQNLRGRQISNGAMVALDYQTGEVVAYVGSADYYATKATKKFQPKFDVLSDGWRQPGSAFKPFNYVTGIDERKITAGSMFMDVVTDFGGGYVPTDADDLERGPVRVRNALQFSLNIPAVKALDVNGVQDVFDRARQFGMVFQGSQPTAGLSMTLGTEVVHPVDVTTAYGTLANNGAYIGRTTILRVTDSSGQDVVPPYQPPTPKQVVSPQAAAIVTNILSGNTDPSINPFWGKFSVSNGKQRYPATLKTGTNNDAKDLNAYGFIAPPDATARQAGQYALAVGVWNGNSDNTIVSSPQNPVFSIDVATYEWQGFMNQAVKGWTTSDFTLPSTGIDQAKIDPFTGLASTSGRAITELFLSGTAPTAAPASGSCGIQLLQQSSFESSHSSWLSADQDWLSRAAQGAGVSGGLKRKTTAYFYNGQFTPFGHTWGAVVGGTCGASPSVCPSFALASGQVAPSAPASGQPCPTAPPIESASPSIGASVPPSILPSLTPVPTPPPTATPTTAPTPTPTPTKPPPSAPPSAIPPAP
jgi:peptidoglycan glycosyltransferase